MILGRAFTVGLVGAVAFASLCAQERPADDTIKVETRLVSVPVVVSDRNGRYISGLSQRDFTLYQDGVEQRIEFFAAVEEPINVALLIDTSQSTRPVLDDIKDSARAFLKLLKPADKAMIVAFDYDTHILSPLTSDHQQLRKAIDQAEIPRYFGTMMRDAVIETVSGAFRDLVGRKAIILLTDGKDVGSSINETSLLYRMQETDALVYSVMFRTGGLAAGRMRNVPVWVDPRPRIAARVGAVNQRAMTFLEQLAGMTAGRFLISEDGKLKKTFDAIVEELRYQYRLGYYPPDENGVRSVHYLKVKVARPDAAVRARSSYRAP